MRRGLAVAAAVVAIDQLVKAWVVGFFAARSSDVFTVFPAFNLVMAWNRGVSFGLFNGGGGTLIFAALAAAIVAGLLWWLSRARERDLQIAIGLVIGGAVGNIIDRLARGAVVDFLDFHLGGLHWFAFNVADAAICLGVFFIAVDGLLGEGRRN
ncbi:MAG: signal peptidase II [Alphaproteobacteria bacterium]|nr:signal peptidase II [Alphaproteobacteria bacterium]